MESQVFLPIRISRFCHRDGKKGREEEGKMKENEGQKERRTERRSEEKE